MDERPRIRVYDSLEEQNRAERRRLAAMTPEERMREFGILQVRRWGEAWTATPIVKVATWEVDPW